MFLRDCQEWGWIPRRFDPGRSLKTPGSIVALMGPDPRVIADDVWAKLLWAGLNLTPDDLPVARVAAGPGKHQGVSWYPLEMMRAMVITWLFCGLRADEFCRLRLGCIQWQGEERKSQGVEGAAEQGAVCLLQVPVNKTSAAFTKPVDRVVGEAIDLWEQVRPPQPGIVDRKTGEVVHALFSYRGYQVGHDYINKTLIPMLCRKAGIPTQDARGPISSHRARSTIATQLYNAKEPLTLFELQEWLGHSSPYSTQQYARISPTRLTKSFQKAGYFERNLRTVEVLIDQEAITSGAAANGEPWKFYDLGHGYCTYTFFDQCPHRMACAKCSFYRPKGTSQASLLEGKANLQRMLQAIPLTDDERAAVEDGITAMEKLCERLAEVSTPAGPTPSQLGKGRRQALPILPAPILHQERPQKSVPKAVEVETAESFIPTQQGPCEVS